MKASSYIGRVGGLAAALGVGAGIFLCGAGVAEASPDDSSTAADADTGPVDESAARSHSAPRPTARPHGIRTSSEASPTRGIETTPTPASSKRKDIAAPAGAKDNTEPPSIAITPPLSKLKPASAELPESSDNIGELATTLAGDNQPPALPPLAAAPQGLPVSRAVLAARSPAVTSALSSKPPQLATAAKPEAAPVEGAVEGIRSPLLGSNPNAPLESPLTWVMLAAARREFDTPAAATVTAGQLAAPTALAKPAPPLGELLTAIVRKLRGAFFNSSPTASPLQVEESATGVVTGTIGAIDADGDPLTYKVIQAPAHGDVAINAEGIYTYTPDQTAAHNGTTDAFTVSVSDNSNGFHIHGLSGLISLLTAGRSGSTGDAITTTATVTVTAVNSAPTLTLTTTPNADGTTSIAVVATDTDSDPFTTTATLANGHGTLATTSGGYLFTPDADYAHNLSIDGGTTPGADTVIVTATDDRGSSTTAKANLTVTPTNEIPVAVDDGPFEIAQNTSRTFSPVELLTNDTDANTGDVLKIASVGDAIHGTAVVNTDGTITFTPTLGYFGAAQFTYQATDPTGTPSNPAIVSIAVINRAPVFANPPVEATQDPDTGVFTGRASAIDPEGETIQYGLANLVDPTYADVSIDPDTGEFNFTPSDLAHYVAAIDPNARTITFTITASDGVNVTTSDVPVPITPRHPADDGILDLADLDTLAQYGAVLVDENDNGLIGAIIGTFTDDKVTNADDALRVLNKVAGVLGAEGGFTGFIEVQTTNFDEESGGVPEAFYRLTQTVNDVPVLGGEVVLATHEDGTVTGVFAGAIARLSELDTVPDSRLDDPEEVLSAAAQSLADSLDIPDEELRSAFLSAIALRANLVVYALDPNVEPRLAWRVSVSTNPIMEDPDDQSLDQIEQFGWPPISGTMYIAANGEDAGAVIAVESDIEAAGVSTTDTANGRTINIVRDGNTYRLIDRPRNITTSRLTYGGFLGWGGLEDTKGRIVEKGLFGWDSDAVLAHSNMAKVYDYYTNVLRRNSYDGKGSQIKIALDLNSDNFLGLSLRFFTDYNNANWNHKYKTIYFGEGAGMESAVDVIGHEYTHAVIDSIIGTGENYWASGESGALNEAYADIIGSLIEGKSGDPRWKIGEDSSNGTFRNMSNPSQYKTDGITYRDNYNDRYTGTKDDKGEHINSTIFSFAAYQMMTDPRTSRVSSKDWARIYEGSLHRLPKNATFQNARNAVIASASVNGLNSQEMKAITDAFDAVNIKTSRVKITLRWGANPADLDSHLTGPTSTTGPRFHVYYRQPNYLMDGTYTNAAQNEVRRSADLDYDDTTSYGPETITIRNLVPGDYYFYVNDFTNGDSANSTALSHSGAIVTVLKPGQNTGGTIFRVNGSSPGTTWTVFKLTIREDGTVSLTAVNTYGYEEPYFA